MKNEQIARAFYEGDEGKTPNNAFFCENINGVGIVFSWGYHFPIAINFKDGFLFNKEGYSQSTTRHKNLILSYIEHELSETDFKDTQELKLIVAEIRYNDIKSKAELIESKI